MTRDEFPQIFSLFDKDRYAAHSHMELVEVRSGYARCRMTVAEEHLNGVDSIQGGALFTFADFCFGATGNSLGRIMLAVNATISFYKSVGAGVVLVAEGNLDHTNHKLANITVNVTEEATGDLVARFTGVGYRKKDVVPGAPDELIS